MPGHVPAPEAGLLTGVVRADDLGPAAVVLLRHAPTGTTAAVVVDNVAAGPAIGGVRMAADVTVEEVARLARAMTLKNAMAGLPHGGAKAGIAADPAMPATGKEAVIRWFARAIADLRDYIVGPDMGTDERCMAWIHDEIGRAVGLPAVLGGIPLDTMGATGYGLAVAADALAERGVLELHGARVAVQGFGAVGTHAARFLAERGAVLVAVSDSRGAVENQAGLDLDALLAWKAAGKPVGTFAGGDVVERDDLVATDCELLVPAARPDVVTSANVDRVKAKVVLEGANIPLTLDAERRLHDAGVLCLPDFVANAGGVICASVEHAGGTAAQAFQAIADKVGTNVAAVLERSLGTPTLPREAAEVIAVERVREAMALRRAFPGVTA
ncbi:MAG TPA: Glu/Leu/Phe/Val dehydrogenase [Acidimicrobiales bacterium]|nr:Glu/Leu/Phe/Val dehydrogenase [Acidimicrobiales bacterium]